MSHTQLLERLRFVLGEFGESRRIYLRHVRWVLNDVATDELTQAIRDLSQTSELTLYPLDDPRSITPEDEAAAINSSTGVPQHILYFGGFHS